MQNTASKMTPECCATASEKYFDTGVYFEELPDEAKNKVTNGLYFFNETDLYDFLESYSS